MRLDPRRQFTGHERLGDVVVTAGGKGYDLVDLLRLGAQKDNGGIGDLADIKTQLRAIHIRKHDVQNDQVRPEFPQCLHGFFAVKSRARFKAFLLKTGSDQLVDC